MPQVAEGVPVAYLDPSAPWAGSIGGVVDGRTLAPVAVATVHLTYKGADAGEDHVDTYEAVIHPLPATTLDPASVHSVDHDPRDFVAEAPPGASYAPVDAPIRNKTYWTGLATALRDHLVREQRLSVLAAPGLKLSSRVGESEADFTARARAAAEDAADAEVAKLTDKHRARIDRARERIAAAERRVAELQVGTLLPETGDLAFLGPPEVAGARLAVPRQDINDAGGVLGNDVVLIEGDSGDTNRHRQPDRRPPPRGQRRRDRRCGLVGGVQAGDRQDRGANVISSRRPTPRPTSPPTTTTGCTSVPPRPTCCRARCWPPDRGQGNATTAVIYRQESYGEGLANAFQENYEASAAPSRCSSPTRSTPRTSTPRSTRSSTPTPTPSW
jgi:hypothetical protein